MFTLDSISRKKAFLVHLGLSLLVFLVLLCFLVLVWFPSPLFGLEGGWQGLRIIIFVDLVLGPVLTLVLFKPGKPGLKLDMTMIILFQLSAMTWGVYTVYMSRPAIVVFADDAFYSVPYSRLKDSVEPDVFQRISGFSPKYYYVDLPQEKEARAIAIREANEAGQEIFLLHELYQPLEERLPELMQASVPMPEYTTFAKEWQQKLTDFEHRSDKPMDDLAFIPLIARLGRGLLVYDVSANQAIDYLDITYSLPYADKARRMRKESAASTDAK